MVVLIIEADISGILFNDYLQTRIDSLGADFVYDGHSGLDSTKTSDVLISFSQIIGGTLSN